MISGESREPGRPGWVGFMPARIEEDIMSTRVRWLGHSCLLFESGGQQRADRPVPDGQPQGGGQTPSEVPADLILISHGHGDHVGDAVAIAQRTGATVAVQLRDRQLAAASPPRADQGPRPPARRRLHLRQRDPGQADPGLPRLGAARRQQRRQPVRLPAHASPTGPGSTTRPTPASSATWP